MSEALRERLTGYLARELGGPVRLEGWARLAGGVSRETWAFDLVPAGGGAAQPLVLRMDTERPFIEGSRAVEFAVVRWAGACGVPVPEVRWCCEDPAVLGGAFFVMERLEGESRVQRLHRDDRYAAARARIVPQAAAALAAIHRMRPGDAPEGVHLPLRPPARELADLDALYRKWAVEPHPVLELAFRWLAPRLPEQGEVALSHGDFRPGNLLFDGEGLRAVLDWELAQFGDPRMDLAWFCLRSWRGGRDDLAAGGVATRDEWLDAYRAAGGDARAGEDWAVWDVLAHLRWAVVTVMEVGGFLAGLPNLELANLGRRTAEVEWDLLALLEAEG